MRLTRRIVLPTGLEICLSAGPLTRDETPGRTEAVTGERGNNVSERRAEPPPEELPSPRRG